MKKSGFRAILTVAAMLLCSCSQAAENADESIENTAEESIEEESIEDTVSEINEEESDQDTDFDEDETETSSDIETDEDEYLDVVEGSYKAAALYSDGNFIYFIDDEELAEMYGNYWIEVYNDGEFEIQYGDNWGYGIWLRTEIEGYDNSYMFGEIHHAKGSKDNHSDPEPGGAVYAGYVPDGSDSILILSDAEYDESDPILLYAMVPPEKPFHKKRKN